MLLDLRDQVEAAVERVEQLAVEAGDPLAQPLQLRVDVLVRTGQSAGDGRYERNVTGASTGTGQFTVNTSPFVSGVPGNSSSSPSSLAS